MPKLNAKMLENLKPPATGRLELTDTEARGLKFRMTASGAASWSLMVNVNQEKRRFTLGEYPAVGLADARKAAEKLRAEALKGFDPIREARAERARRKALRTVAEVLEFYLDAHVRPNLRTAGEREASLRRELAGRLDTVAEDLTGADLQAVIDAKVKTAPVRANRLRNELRHFAKWAAMRGHFPSNIGANLIKPTKERERDRVLSLEEVRIIYEACADLGEPFGPLLRLLILTAQRLSDVAEMRLGEVDLQRAVWNIPSARAKNAAAHVVHLSEPALIIVRERVALAEARAKGEGRSTQPGDFLFIGRAGTPPSGWSKLHPRLNRLIVKRRIAEGVAADAAELQPWTRHDIRTAFATAMAEAGEGEGVVDRVLNHVARSSAASAVARVYNRSQLLPQRARALDRWAEMVTGERAKVVKLAVGEA